MFKFPTYPERLLVEGDDWADKPQTVAELISLCDEYRVERVLLLSPDFPPRDVTEDVARDLAAFDLIDADKCPRLFAPFFETGDFVLRAKAHDVLRSQLVASVELAEAV
jgi:hypothetical protein